MKCVVILLIAICAIICSATVHPTAYNPVFEYDVPVASQPIAYPRPAYVRSYGYASPAVSHSYSSHTQTHPATSVSSFICFMFIFCEEEFVLLLCEENFNF